MPLNVAGATSQALAAMEAQRTAQSQQENADRWAEVLATFFGPATLPPPGPGRAAAIDAARQQAASILGASSSATGLASMAAAVAAFGAALVASTVGAVATPPPAPYVLVGDPTGATGAAQAFVGSLLAWSTTGTSTLLAPGSPPTPWA
jgi:hypothetical protein